MKMIELHAQPSVEPTLTAEEIEYCLNYSRVVDRAGRRINEVGYDETIWGTRAVVLALEAKVSKAHTITDFNADGTSIAASQLVENLKSLRGSWRAKCLPGSV